MGLSLVDMFIIGAIVHFCILGLYLVRYIEDNIDVLRNENNSVQERNDDR